MDLDRHFDRRHFLHVVASALTVSALARSRAFAAAGK